MKIERTRFEFKLEDMWIGAFWKHIKIKTDEGDKIAWTDVYICFIPCVPLRITINWQPTILFNK